MTDFYNTILKVISDYKSILRRSLSQAECTAKIKELGIKRNHIKSADEVGLYKIGLKIIGELKKCTLILPDKRSSNFYHGAEEFLKHLEKLFSQYLLEGESSRVVHVKQKVTAALVAAIQLVALHKKNLTQDIISKIAEYRECVTKYGNDEEKKLFADKVNLVQNESWF